jgi:hypothetical protein
LLLTAVKYQATVTSIMVSEVIVYSESEILPS